MAKKIEYEVNIKTKSAVESTNQLQGSLKGVESQADKLTGGLITKFRGATQSVGGFVKGLKTVKGAFIATGIGAFVVVLGSLVTFFTKTQRGADLLAKATDALGAAFSVIVDRISTFGESIVKFFQGDFKGALDSVKASFAGLGDEIVREANAAARLRGELNALKDEEIGLIEVNAQRRKGIAEARLIAEDETKSLQERIKALDEATALENAILDDQLRIARERARISQEQLDLGESSREEIEANAQLQAQVAELETRSLQQQKSIFTRRNALIRQANAEQEAIRKEEQAKIDTENLENQKKEEERLKSIETLTDTFRKKAEDRDAETQLQKAELEEQRTLLELERLGATEQQKLDIVRYYEDLKNEAKQTDRQKELDEEKKQNEEKDKLRQEDLDREMSKLEAEASIQNAKFGLLNQFGGFLKEIAGDSKELQIAAVIAQQAAAIGQIVSNTGIANAKAIAASPLSFGQPWVGINSISAGLSIATAVASGVKSIQQIKSSDNSSTAPTAPSLRSGSSGASSTPPAINTVGTSGISQLAQTIQGQNQQPIRAYVVSGDVTTAQSLDRNIVQEAGI